MTRVDGPSVEPFSGTVGHKTLGEVGTFLRGNGLQKTDFTDEGVPCIHYGQIYTFYGTATATTKSFVSPELAARLKKAECGDLVVTTTSENVDDVCMAVAWLGEPQVAIGGHSCVYKHTLEPKYVSYFFQSEQFQSQKRKFVSGTKVKDIKLADLAQIRIPVPPMAVQREIVSVLDRLESLEAKLELELDAELGARRQQYEHLRDQLVASDIENSAMLTLREVAVDFGRGRSRHRPRNDPRLYGGAYPFVQTGDVRNSNHVVTAYSQTYSEEGLAQSKLWPRGTICITIAANIAETGILDFDACFPDSVIGMVVDPERASAPFVEYLLEAHRATLVAKGQGSAQANINLATFESTRFPFPSVEVQMARAAVLDNFRARSDLLGVALREEIAARRLQYAYHRDKLFSFEERVA